MEKEKLIKYAKLLIKSGLNVQSGQEVNIIANLEVSYFVEMCTEQAYLAGAKKVDIDWINENIDKLKYQYESVETLGEVNEVKLAKLNHRKNVLPARLYISSENPDGMKGVDQVKLASARQLSYPLMKPYLDAIDNKEQWCIAGVPGKKWAKKVYPDLNENEAVEKLWEDILASSRADGNPIKNWEQHNKKLHQKVNKLNSLNLKELHYTSSNGTDFKVGLINGGLFAAGSETTLTGIEINPNIPSEECFTSPYKGKAEGIVYASKPLSYQGELIEDFYFVFKNGKVIEAHAKKNEELLRKMISMDEGAAYLGECALIPYHSPINDRGILFYNTLFDENASCHLALGMGFTNLYKDYEKYSIDELHQKGINDSMIHVDFMIGTKDMNIVGETYSGVKVQIFKNGEWSI